MNDAAQEALQNELGDWVSRQQEHTSMFQTHLPLSEAPEALTSGVGAKIRSPFNSCSVRAVCSAVGKNAHRRSARVQLARLPAENGGRHRAVARATIHPATSSVRRRNSVRVRYEA